MRRQARILTVAAATLLGHARPVEGPEAWDTAWKMVRTYLAGVG